MVHQPCPGILRLGEVHPLSIHQFILDLSVPLPSFFSSLVIYLSSPLFLLCMETLKGQVCIPADLSFPLYKAITVLLLPCVQNVWL